MMTLLHACLAALAVGGVSVDGSSVQGVEISNFAPGVPIGEKLRTRRAKPTSTADTSECSSNALKRVCKKASGCKWFKGSCVAESEQQDQEQTDALADTCTEPTDEPTGISFFAQG
jgi:hypothetical protein